MTNCKKDIKFKRCISKPSHQYAEGCINLNTFFGFCCRPHKLWEIDYSGAWRGFHDTETEIGIEFLPLCVGHFWEREKAFKPQIKNKSFHCFLPPPPLSKSYERVFINDWGAASLNKWKVKGSISFLRKRLFFSWNVPFRCCLIRLLSGERISVWFVQIFYILCTWREGARN